MGECRRMKTIKVAGVIQNAFSSEQAKLLKSEIEKELVMEENVELDFTDISKFTTLFFNFSTGYFISKLGKTEYDRRIKVKNLTKLGESAYRNSYENAVGDNNKSNVEDEIMSILSSPDE